MPSGVASSFLGQARIGGREEDYLVGFTARRKREVPSEARLNSLQGTRPQMPRGRVEGHSSAASPSHLC